MAFSSLIFIFLFLPVCTALYFLVNTKYRNAVLIVFSIIFYAWGEPVYIWLLLFATCMNYLFGKMISYGKGTAPKFGLILGILMNIGILAAARYTGFIIETINNISGADFPVPDCHFPIGISFFMFRAVSYLIDCHWGKVNAEKNFSSFLLYMTLFPIAVQGPVVRYETIALQLHSRNTTIIDFSEGAGRICIGIAKKVLIADQLGEIADQFLRNGAIENQTVLGAWYGVIMFALQVYFDFSGYSDMAIGMGRIFGFKFEENFRHPFMCSTVTDFWQRWHISLGKFFRDYLLYVPIFGKRRKFGGLFLVWICAGLWHGFSLNFLLWGIYNGVFIAIDILLGKKSIKRIPAAVRHIYSKIVIITGFCIFCFTDYSELILCLKNMFLMGEGDFADALLISSVKSNILLILAAVAGCFPLLGIIKKRLSQLSDKNTVIAAETAGTVLMIAMLAVSGMFLADSAARPFFYLQF